MVSKEFLGHGENIDAPTHLICGYHPLAWPASKFIPRGCGRGKYPSYPPLLLLTFSSLCLFSESGSLQLGTPETGAAQPLSFAAWKHWLHRPVTSSCPLTSFSHPGGVSSDGQTSHVAKRKAKRFESKLSPEWGEFAWGLRDLRSHRSLLETALMVPMSTHILDGSLLLSCVQKCLIMKLIGELSISLSLWPLSYTEDSGFQSWLYALHVGGLGLNSGNKNLLSTTRSHCQETSWRYPQYYQVRPQNK